MSEKLRKEMMLASRFMRGFHNRPKGQENILKAIYDGKATTQQDIGEYLEVTPGTVSEMISKLEHKGLVERSRSEQDRRNVEISLTEEGKSRAEELSAQKEDDLFEVLSEQEKETLTELLTRLNNDWLRKIPMRPRRGSMRIPEGMERGCRGRFPHRPEGEMPREKGRGFEGRHRFVRHERQVGDTMGLDPEDNNRHNI